MKLSPVRPFQSEVLPFETTAVKIIWKIEIEHRITFFIPIRLALMKRCRPYDCHGAQNECPISHTIQLPIFFFKIILNNELNSKGSNWPDAIANN